MLVAILLLILLLALIGFVLEHGKIQHGSGERDYYAGVDDDEE